MPRVHHGASGSCIGLRLQHWGALLLASHGLAAQNALDRTNPLQQITRDRPMDSVEQPVRIEMQPVIELPEPARAGGSFAVGRQS